MGAVVSSLTFQPPKPASYSSEHPYPVTFAKSPKTGRQIALYHLKAKTENVKTTILYSHGRFIGSVVVDLGRNEFFFSERFYR